MDPRQVCTCLCDRVRLIRVYFDLIEKKTTFRIIFENVSLKFNDSLCTGQIFVEEEKNKKKDLDRREGLKKVREIVSWSNRSNWPLEKGR